MGGEMDEELLRQSLKLLIFHAVLAINKSKGFVYVNFVLRSVSRILSMRTVFCIDVAYAAYVVEDDKKVATFSLITGVTSASHILGSVLAKYLPEMYIF